MCCHSNSIFESHVVVIKISWTTSGTNALLCVGNVFLAIPIQLNISGTILLSRSTGWSPDSFFFSFVNPITDILRWSFLLGSFISQRHTPLVYLYLSSTLEQHFSWKNWGVILRTVYTYNSSQPACIRH